MGESRRGESASITLCRWSVERRGGGANRGDVEEASERGGGVARVEGVACV